MTSANGGTHFPRRHALFAVGYTALAAFNTAGLYHFVTRGNGGWAAFFTLSLIASILSVALRISEIGEAE